MTQTETAAAPTSTTQTAVPTTTEAQTTQPVANAPAPVVAAAPTPIKPLFNLYDMTQSVDFRNPEFNGRVPAVLVGLDQFTSAKGSDGVRMLFQVVQPGDANLVDVPPDYFAACPSSYDDGTPVVFSADGYLTGGALAITFGNLFTAGWQVPEDRNIDDNTRRLDARIDAGLEKFVDCMYDPTLTAAERWSQWAANFTYAADEARVQDVKGLIWDAATMGVAGPLGRRLSPVVELSIEQEEYPAGSGKFNTKVKGIWRPKGNVKAKTKEEATRLVASLKRRVAESRAGRSAGGPPDVNKIAPGAARARVGLAGQGTVVGTGATVGAAATGSRLFASPAQGSLPGTSPGTLGTSSPRVTVKDGVAGAAGAVGASSDEDVPF